MTPDQPLYTRRESRRWQAAFLVDLIDRHNLGAGTTSPEVCHSVCELHREIEDIGNCASITKYPYPKWKKQGDA